METDIQISIVLVSYNTKTYTIRALQSVIDETRDTNYEVIVVDNQSSDGSSDAIRSEFPSVKVIDSGANLGFAGGVHRGVKESRGEKVLLLNPDTIVLDRAIDKLVAFSESHPNNGIWGGVTLNNDHSVNTQHAWAKHNFRSLLFSALGISKIFSKSCFFNEINYGCWDRKSVKEVDIVSGCFFLTTRQLWEELDGLDPTFFMYAEEADYCLRAIKKGKRPIVCPESKIIHHGGVSHSNLSGKTIKLLRGKAELILRHDSSYRSFIYIRLLLLYCLNKLISSSMNSRNSTLHSEWKKVFQERKVWMRGYR